MSNHPTALTRQIEESVAIDKKMVNVLMNSKGEWNSQKIPRIVVQVQGRDEEEEGERLPIVESWAVPVRYKPRRRTAEEAGVMASSKRRRVGDIPDNREGDAAEPEAAGGGDGEQQEAAQGEGDRPELEQKAPPLPVRIPQAKSKTRKTSSRGKGTIVDPGQQTIKKFFKKIDAEETGKLESSDRLNLESENAGMSGAAAGVGLESEAGPSQSNEKRNCTKNN